MLAWAVGVSGLLDGVEPPLWGWRLVEGLGEARDHLADTWLWERPISSPQHHTQAPPPLLLGGDSNQISRSDLVQHGAGKGAWLKEQQLQRVQRDC